MYACVYACVCGTISTGLRCVCVCVCIIAMVRFCMGIGRERISIFYQNDSFGHSCEDALETALYNVGMCGTEIDFRVLYLVSYV